MKEGFKRGSSGSSCKLFNDVMEKIIFILTLVRKKFVDYYRRERLIRRGVGW